MHKTPTETGARVELRPMTTEAEFAACVQMQKDIWGDGYGELVPPVILQIVQKVGGVAAGAFTDDGTLAGFVFGITGVKDGRLVHWSHILAVLPELRNSGVGALLKEYQRDQLRPLGVESIYWTFDPLVAKNAHFNLNRLGAEVVEYVVDMYGRTGSILHTLGTDRLIVDWRIADDGEAPRAGARLATSGAEPGPVANLTEAGAPLDPEIPLPDSSAVRIAIPADIDELLRREPDLASRWQRTVQRAFLHYLGEGYGVTGFDRAAGARICYYHLAAPGRR